MFKVFAQPHSGTRGANGAAGATQRQMNKATGVAGGASTQGNYNRNRGIAEQMAKRYNRGLQG